MSESNEQDKSFNHIERKVVEFGSPDAPEGLAWGIEINFDITSPLVKRVFSGSRIKIPPKITTITYLDLCPQEELPPSMRTIRSKFKPGQSVLKTVANPVPNKLNLEKFLRFWNIMMPQDEKRFALLDDMICQAVNKDKLLRKFNQVLTEATGDSIVIVHGHSADLSDSSAMGEQYPDEVIDSDGRVIQRKHNAVPIKEILERYDDPNKYTVIVLNGCNPKAIGPTARKVPVFYPRNVTSRGRGGFVWSREGGFSIPGESSS